VPNSGPPWRVLVADDEPAARRGVRQLLAAHPDFVVAAECRNGAEVLTALERVDPDLVFLDIQMPEIDGFEVIRRRTSARMPVVIFLTAYDEFAIQAFEAEVLDYLVKPVTEARFGAAIRRAARQLATRPGPPAKLAVTTPRGTVVLDTTEIDWIESADNYARVWVGPKSYLLRQPMRTLEIELRSQGFSRIHRGALVRLRAIRQLLTLREGELVAILGSGQKIPVSRRRRAALMAAVRQTR
jgi:two-component system LytT family response regulator